MMSYTNRILIVLFCLLNLQNTYADTYYYKLTKKIDGDKIYTNTRGGQFVTIEDDICYDSDYTGNSVGNGKLYYNKYINGVHIYVGNCYFGANSQYKFSADKYILNILVADGRIYVYKRSTPPDGVYTCSLIRPSQEKSGENRDPYNPINPIPQPYPYPTQTQTPEQTTVTTTPQKHWKTITYQEDCHFCHGSGKCWTCNGKGWCYNDFGIDGTHDCPNCTNGNCTHCNGTGKVTKTKQVYE